MSLRLSVAVALMAAIATTSMPGLASAESTPLTAIDGVWSFNGGQIAVRPAPNGSLEGRVVGETRFAECTHPIDQRIWSDMKQQPDGSYFGFHQWYFEVASCPLNPNPGPTAWRVLEGPGGVHYLRVCLSSPGGPQPTIDQGGSSTGVTYGCVDSARVGSLPSSQALSLKQLVSLPSAKKCVSRRVFKVHVRDPSHDPFKTILISIAGRRLRVVRHGAFSVATVNLNGLPRGTFTLRVQATTVLGRRLGGKRRYRTCVNRRAPRPHHRQR